MTFTFFPMRPFFPDRALKLHHYRKAIDYGAQSDCSYHMSTNVDKIVSEALELAPEARAFVAEKLIESLDAEPMAELSPAWREEIRKRCREIDRGLVELPDAEDVFARARSALE